MKILLDYLPILFFFVTFRVAEAKKEWATRFANDHFSYLVSGGVVGPDEAPVLLATLIVIAVSLALVLMLLIRRKPVGKMLWLTLAIVVVLGGATVWFHDKTFILWKPTMVYWVTGIALWVSERFLKKNLIREALGGQFELPAPIWHRMTLAWVLFFIVMGFLNLYVGFNFELHTWVNFKLYGGIGLPLLLALGTGLYLSKHLPPEEAQTPKLPS